MRQGSLPAKDAPEGNCRRPPGAGIPRQRSVGEVLALLVDIGRG